MSSALGVGRLAAQGCERALATASRRPPSGTGIASATGLRSGGRGMSVSNALACSVAHSGASHHPMSCHTGVLLPGWLGCMRTGLKTCLEQRWHCSIAAR